MHAPDLKPIPVPALAELGLEPPPANPFGEAPPVATEPAPPPDKPINLNRAQRRRLRAVSMFDTRLLARVAQYDLAQHAKTATTEALYPTERAATYGLEKAAKAMRLAKLLTRAEQTRVSFLARNRRLELTRGR